MRRRLRDAGIRVVLIPERAPNANAYAERFVRSIKEECLDRIIPIGERHFRHAITEFVEHYHRERSSYYGSRSYPSSSGSASCRPTWSRVSCIVAAAFSSCARIAAGSPRFGAGVLFVAKRGPSSEKILVGSTVSRYSSAVPRRYASSLSNASAVMRTGSRSRARPRRLNTCS